MTSITDDILAQLQSYADPQRAQASVRFFATHPGGYGEGDVFLGVTVPIMRRIAKKAIGNLEEDDLSLLMKHSLHEMRFVGSVIITQGVKKRGRSDRIRDFFVAHRDARNNRDLVDMVAPYIVGPQIEREGLTIFEDRITSETVRHRRLVVVGCLYLIRRGQYDEILSLAERLRNDPHDLMHKAIGRMLREVGKKSLTTLTDWLDKRAGHMPRTTICYAVEKLSPEEKKRIRTIPRQTDPETPLILLMGLGPKSVPQLEQAGFHTKQDLRDAGIRQAYSRRREVTGSHHAMMAYVLYAAMHDIDYREVPEHIREDLTWRIREAKKLEKMGKSGKL